MNNTLNIQYCWYPIHLYCLGHSDTSNVMNTYYCRYMEFTCLPSGRVIQLMVWSHFITGLQLCKAHLSAERIWVHHLFHACNNPAIYHNKQWMVHTHTHTHTTCHLCPGLRKTTALHGRPVWLVTRLSNKALIDGSTQERGGRSLQRTHFHPRPAVPVGVAGPGHSRLYCEEFLCLVGVHVFQAHKSWRGQRALAVSKCPGKLQTCTLVWPAKSVLPGN